MDSHVRSAPRNVKRYPFRLDSRFASNPLKTIHRCVTIVVGAGISGLAAALELGRGGANVTVIDMSSVFGGHAVMSQGSLSIVGSPVQEAAGFHDTPDLAYHDIIEFGEDADAAWARYYVENSRREVYDWVSELGVRFEGVAGGMLPESALVRSGLLAATVVFGRVEPDGTAMDNEEFSTWLALQERSRRRSPRHRGLAKSRKQPPPGKRRPWRNRG